MINIYYTAFFFKRNARQMERRERLRPVIKSNVNKSEERQKHIKYLRRYSCHAVTGILETERALLHLAQLIILYFFLHRDTRIKALRALGRLAHSYGHFLIHVCKQKYLTHNINCFRDIFTLYRKHTCRYLPLMIVLAQAMFAVTSKSFSVSSTSKIFAIDLRFLCC